jgi:RNA polymerase sigma-70 factor (ECF subfamily)
MSSLVTADRPRHVDRDDPRLDDAVATFDGLRPRLLGIAQRVLGRWAEAEDVVQDAWVRWQRCDRTRVENATAFLVTTTTRLALNALSSARIRREVPVHQWAPEPSDGSDGPAEDVARLEDLERGLLLLLERLTPDERAAFVLRKAFGYSYERIAMLLCTSPTNARQLVSRAGARLPSVRRRPASDSDPGQLITAFVNASRRGDTATLEGVLSASARRRSRETAMSPGSSRAGLPALVAS